MKFTKTFTATYKRPANVEELRACIQKKGESIRSYIARWTNIHNAAKGVSEERGIDAFVAGISHEDLKEELGCLGPATITHLMEIANKWAKGEDSVRRDRTRPREDDYEDDARYQDEPDRCRDRRRKRGTDRKSTRLNSSHRSLSRMPSSA